MWGGVKGVAGSQKSSKRARVPGTLYNAAEKAQLHTRPSLGGLEDYFPTILQPTVGGPSLDLQSSPPYWTMVLVYGEPTTALENAALYSYSLGALDASCQRLENGTNTVYSDDAPTNADWRCPHV